MLWRMQHMTHESRALLDAWVAHRRSVAWHVWERSGLLSRDSGDEYWAPTSCTCKMCAITIDKVPSDIRNHCSGIDGRYALRPISIRVNGVSLMIDYTQPCQWLGLQSWCAHDRLQFITACFSNIRLCSILWQSRQCYACLLLGQQLQGHLNPTWRDTRHHRIFFNHILPAAFPGQDATGLLSNATQKTPAVSSSCAKLHQQFCWSMTCGTQIPTSFDRPPPIARAALTVNTTLDMLLLSHNMISFYYDDIAQPSQAQACQETTVSRSGLSLKVFGPS